MSEIGYRTYHEWATNGNSRIVCLFKNFHFELIKLTLSARAKRDAGKRDALSDLIGYLDKRLSMMAYKDLIDEDMVIASGIVEGAARYVVGERLDCSGMRWIPERAEVLLHLRCIELNGDWERFFAWSYQRWLDQMQTGQRVLIRTDQADALPTAASIEDTDDHDLEPSQHVPAA
jgi:hypothetical protein